MKQTNFLILVLVALLASCSSKTETKRSMLTLPDPTVIVPEELSYDLVMSPPLEIKTFGDYLIFTQPMMGKSLLFYNRITRQQNYWETGGSGPDDFMSASCIYQNEKDSIIKLYDTNLRKMVEFKLSSQDNSVSLISKKRYRIETDTIHSMGLHEMENGYYVSHAAFGSKKMFVLFDKDLKVLKTFGSKPIEEMPDGNYTYLYGWFASSGNKLFFAAQPTGYLVSFDISDSGEVAKDWEISFTEPKYETSAFNWTRENKRGFYDIQTNDKYVFLSFSGKTYEDDDVMPQSILILNHEGKLTKHLKYDQDYALGKFTLSGDSIYAIAHDRITRFNWKKEMKR